MASKKSRIVRAIDRELVDRQITNLLGRGTKPMDESEWLTSTDPAAMLRHLTGLPPLSLMFDLHVSLAGARNVSERRLRLFVAACRDLDDPTGAPCDACNDDDVAVAIHWSERNEGDSDDTIAARAAILREIFGNPWRPVTVRYECPACKDDSQFRASGTCNECHGDDPVVTVPWFTTTVMRLARAIYDERAFERMPILADALEEGGCCFTPRKMEVTICEACSGVGSWPEKQRNNTQSAGFRRTKKYGHLTEPKVVGYASCKVCRGRGMWEVGPEPSIPELILTHLRGDNAHCRGCWVLDTILGDNLGTKPGGLAYRS